jgi:hypothetical protein
MFVIVMAISGKKKRPRGRIGTDEDAHCDAAEAQWQWTPSESIQRRRRGGPDKRRGLKTLAVPDKLTWSVHVR